MYLLLSNPARTSSLSLVAVLAILVGTELSAGDRIAPPSSAVQLADLIPLDLPPKKPRRLEGGWHLAFGALGKRDVLASGDEGGHGLKLWEAETGRELLAIPQRDIWIHQHQERGFAISRDGSRIAVEGSGDPGGAALYVLDSRTGKVEHRLSLKDDGYATGLAFAPDGKSLVSTTYSTVRVWDLATGKEAHRLRELAPGQRPADTSEPTGAGVLRGTNPFEQMFSRPRSCDPTGKYVVFLKWEHHASQTDVRFCLWDVPSRKTASTVVARHVEHLWGYALSWDGKLLATAESNNSSGPGRWRVRAVPSGHLLATFPARDFAGDMAFHPSGQWLAVVDAGGSSSTVNIWDLERMELRCSLPTEGFLTTLAFSPSGRFLAGYAGGVRIWEFKVGQR
jgi:WD40 repeat protein